MTVKRFKGASSNGLSGWKVDYTGLSIRGDWATGEKVIIKDNDQYDIKRVQMERSQEARAKYQRQKQAALECEKTWNVLSETEERTTYLIHKKIDNFGCKITGDILHVPARDHKGNIWSVQSIDGNGNKMFYKGGKKKGCSHIIGNIEKPLVFCEGYATGASISMACPDVCIIVCFDAFNLTSVIKEVRRNIGADGILYVAADDDKWKPGIGNTGMAEAKYCCEMFGCKLIAPVFKDESTKPTDFNDLHILEGLGAVYDQIMGALNV